MHRPSQCDGPVFPRRKISRPFPAQFSVDRQNRVVGEVPFQFSFPDAPPVAFERPSLQLNQAHERYAEQATDDMFAKVKAACVPFEQHRHNVGIDVVNRDRGVHSDRARRSRRHAWSNAENCSADSSSGDGWPINDSKSKIGAIPCWRASSSKEEVAGGIRNSDLCRGFVSKPPRYQDAARQGEVLCPGITLPLP